MVNLIDNIEETELATQKDRFLTFLLGRENYGVEIKYVTEIIGIQDITEVPELPEYVKGIINLRGKILPVMDVRLRFKKAQEAYTDRTCVVVMEIDTITIGLIVDSVSEVLKIPKRDIVAPPQMNKDFNNRYIKGIGKAGESIKLLLDCRKLLTAEEFEEISDAL